MITNLYNHIWTDPSYNKIIGSGYLLVEYKCPIETKKFKLLAEENFIMYTISATTPGMEDPIIPLQINDTLTTLFYSICGYLKATPEIPRELLELKFRELLYNIVLYAQN